MSLLIQHAPTAKKRGSPTALMIDKTFEQFFNESSTFKYKNKVKKDAVSRKKPRHTYNNDSSIMSDSRY